MPYKPKYRMLPRLYCKAGKTAPLERFFGGNAFVSVGATAQLSGFWWKALMQDLSIRKAWEVGIWVSRPHQAPKGQPRKETWRDLNQHLDRMGSTVKDLPADQMEKLVDDVCNEDSPRHKPAGPRRDNARWTGTKTFTSHRRRRGARLD